MARQINTPSWMRVRSGRRDVQKVNSAPAYFKQNNTSTHSTLFYLTDMLAPMSSSTSVLHQARSSPPSKAGGRLVLEPSNLQCSVASGSTTVHIQSEVAAEGDAASASRQGRYFRGQGHSVEPAPARASGCGGG